MPTALLSQFLPPEHIAIPLTARTFRAAVTEMIGRLVALGVVLDPAALDEALAAGSGRDVVVIGNQVALPHFRTDAVDRVLVSLGVAPEPLDIGGSGLAVAPRVIALVIAPPEAATLYLQTVAALARFLADDDVVRQLHEATSAAAVAHLPGLGSLQIKPQLTVHDLMLRDVSTATPEMKARSVVDIMVKRGQRALPVVDDKLEVLGIVT